VTDELSGFEEVPFDPGSMAMSSLGLGKNVWYKRPWFLIAVTVVVIAAISIVTDLPHHITKAQDAATQNATIKAINADIKPCAFAANESFSFYNKYVAGKLTPSNLAQVPSLLVGDQTACSFAGQPVYDLTNNIQPLETAAGRHINQMLLVVEKWITDNALASIEDIQNLFAHPGSQSMIAKLTTQQIELSADRTMARNDESKAEAILGITLVPVALPPLPHLSGT